MVEDKAIETEKVIDIIEEQFAELLNLPENVDMFSNIRIICSLEQQFMKIKDKDRNAIYIVIRLGSSSVVFNQAVLPITILALSEENKIELTRNLLLQYALKYNLNRVENDTIQQVYEAPNVVTNFEMLYSGFRSIISVSGVMVVSPNVNFFNVWNYYNVQAQTVDIYSLAQPVALNKQTTELYFDITQNVESLIESIGNYRIITLNDGGQNTSINVINTTLGQGLSFTVGVSTYIIWQSGAGWRNASGAGVTFNASTGIMAFTTTQTVSAISRQTYWVNFISMATSLQQGQYYMQYRLPSLPTYTTGKYYKYTGNSLVEQTNISEIGDNFLEVDLYRYKLDSSDIDQYFLQTPTYPNNFTNGTVYWYNNGEFMEMNVGGVTYLPLAGTIATIQNPVDTTLNGYYQYTGASGVYYGSYYYNGQILYISNGTIYVALSEEVPQLTASFGLVNSPNTQPFYNTNDFAQSTIRFGAVNLNISTFVMNNSQLINTIVDMITEQNGVNVDYQFMLGTQFKDGRTRYKPYRVVSVGMSQDLGQIPSLTLSFAE